MICKRCGTYYEGNFCPKCGTISDEVSKCPHCGNKRYPQERYCTQCGFSYIKNNLVQKVYNFISFIPYFLILIMIPLYLLFNAFPFMTVKDWIGTNLYSLIQTENEELETMATASSIIQIIELIFILISIIYPILIAYYHFLKKEMHMYRLNIITRNISIVLSVAHIVLSIILCVQINKYDNNTDIYGIGIGLILLMVFSIIFTLINCSIPFIKALYCRKFPNLVNLY